MHIIERIEKNAIKNNFTLGHAFGWLIRLNDDAALVGRESEWGERNPPQRRPNLRVGRRHRPPRRREEGGARGEQRDRWMALPRYAPPVHCLVAPIEARLKARDAEKTG